MTADTHTAQVAATAHKIVDDIFADLRDRRWLKWVFGPPGSAEMVQAGVPRIDDAAQVDIADAWHAIIMSHLDLPPAEPAEINGVTVEIGRAVKHVRDRLVGSSMFPNLMFSRDHVRALLADYDRLQGATPKGKG